MEQFINNPMVIALMAAVIGAIVSGILTLFGWSLTRFGKTLWNVSAWKASVDQTLQDLKWKVDKLFDHFIGPVVAGSPLRLTPMGEDIAKEIHADLIVDQFFNKILDEVVFFADNEVRAPGTLYSDVAPPESMAPYEIQERCFAFAKEKIIALLEQQMPSRIKDLKMAAFKHGIRLDQVLDVLGIVLRDRIFKRFDLPLP